MTSLPHLPTEFPSKDISPQKRYTQDLTPGACGRALIRKQSLQMELGQESCFIFFYFGILASRYMGS